MMKRIFLGLTMLSVLPVASFAADPGPYDWTGFYVGVHTGYAKGESSLQNDNSNSSVNWGDDELSDADRLAGIRENCVNLLTADGLADLQGRSNLWDDPDRLNDWCGPPLEQSGSVEGAIGGMQAGWDYQMGRIVVGMVGDISLASISGELDTDIERGPYYTKFESEYTWLSTLRGRLGMLVTDSTLLYGHGGLAAANFRLNNLNTNASGSFSDIHHDDTVMGYVLGFGGETKVTEALSLFAEYSFMDFGSYDGNWWFDADRDSEGYGEEGTYEDPNEGSFSGDNHLSVIKVGFNYNF